eukprot:1092922-Prymnesium_polylepis.1
MLRVLVLLELKLDLQPNDFGEAPAVRARQILDQRAAKRQLGLAVGDGEHRQRLVEGVPHVAAVLLPGHGGTLSLQCWRAGVLPMIQLVRVDDGAVLKHCRQYPPPARLKWRREHVGARERCGRSARVSFPEVRVERVDGAANEKDGCHRSECPWQPNAGCVAGSGCASGAAAGQS